MPSTPAGVNNSQPAANAASNQDILAEIFGSSSETSTTSPPPAQPQKSSVDDILGLFGSSSTPAAAVPQTPSALPSYPATPATAIPSSFHAAAAVPATPATPSAPRHTAYTAYEKNGLKITLTPQTSAAKPGYVVIQARFQATTSSPVTGITFQAAVPKVRQLKTIVQAVDLTAILDSATANAPNVQPNREPWRYGDSGCSEKE